MGNAFLNYLKQDYAVYIVALTAIVLTAWVYPELPEIVPIHWNAAGEADGFAPKIWGAWIMVASALLSHLIVAGSMALDPKRENLENAKVMSIVRAVTPFFLFGIHGVMVLSWLGVPIDIVSWTMFGVGGLFMVLGNVLGKIPQNYMAGARLPWTLENPEVWKKTNRLLGQMMFIGGLGLCVVALAIPSAAVFYIVLLTVSIVVVPVLYAIYHYKNSIAAS